MKCNLGKVLLTLFVFNLVPIVSQAAFVGQTYETIALTGDLVPGIDGAFSDFMLPVLNKSGHIAFRGSFLGPGITQDNDDAVFSTSSSVLSVVARTGDPAPGTGPGITYRFLTSDPRLNEVGQVAFNADLQGPGITSINGDAIFSELDGSLRLAVQRGTTVPVNGPDFVTRGLGAFSLNNSGELAFETMIIGTGVSGENNQVVFLESQGSLTMIARENEPTPLPGFNQDPTAFDFPFSSPSLNSSSIVVFSSDLKGQAIGSSNGTAVFSIEDGVVTTIARQGNTALAGLAGVEFGSLTEGEPPQINSRGDIVFFSFLQGPGIQTALNGRALFFQSGIQRSLVARVGDPAPGTASSNFSSNFTSVSLNNRGQIAFIDLLVGQDGIPTSNGVFFTVDDQLTLVAQTGMSAPGTGAGITYNNFEPRLAFNDVGQVAFLAGLNGPGVDITNRIGLYVADLDGEIRLVARTGDLFDANSDPSIIDERTISGIDFTAASEGDNGRSSSFNESGQLALKLTFADNTEGIFLVSLLSALPLPGDYNADGVVSAEDLRMVLQSWGDTTLPAGFDPAALAGGSFDGQIDINELDLVLARWGDETQQGPVTIPEPSTMLLLLVGLGALSRVTLGRDSNRYAADGTRRCP